jgi:hypothetical protein
MDPMTIRFDEKGKFYTQVISKDAVWVLIQTQINRIRGQIYIQQGERIKDEINHAEQFIAVTDAAIYDNSGKQIYHCDFMTLNRHHIIWLMPDGHSEQGMLDGGDV